MKIPSTSDRRDEAAPLEKKRQTSVEARLVSPPTQRAIREWEITLPDELVDALTMGFI